MLVAIHKTPYGSVHKWLSRYEQILLFNDIRFVRVELGDPSFWDTVSKADLFVFRYGHYDTDHQKAQTLIPLLERQLQIKCFPNVTTCWHYDDKIRQYYLMRNAGFPMTDS